VDDVQQQGSADHRSERACPVCGRHELAIDRLPRIDVLGVQPYSDLIGMGDARPRDTPGIVCLACGTRWRDLDAFEANEPEPAESLEGPGEPDPGDSAEDEPGG
jgi:C4-type Zn-finger protein